MPINEDEYERRPQQPMSKAELRRSNKPIMEKRRRARINHCLNELKTLILEATKKDPSRHSKLEKADILEMTVKYLHSVQQQQLAIAVATDPSVLHKFKMGFNECATEASRYLGRIDGVETGAKQRLVAHLTNCVTALQQLSPFSFAGIGTGLLGGVFQAMSPSTSSSSTTLHVPIQSSNGNPQLPQPNGDVNNNQANRLVSGGLQLIPSRLPTGELALLVPNTSQLPFFQMTTSQTTTNTTSFVSRGAAIPSSTVTSGAIDRSRPSAFTAVTRSQSPHNNSNQDTAQPRITQVDINSTAATRLRPVSPVFTSSSEDEDDDEAGSESYLSPYSPPINRLSHPHSSNIRKAGYDCNDVQQSAFQTMGDRSNFKVSFSGSSAAFKPFHQQPNDNEKTHQYLLVTSSTHIETPSSSNNTNVSSSNGNFYTDAKLELKTDPVLQNAALPSVTNMNSSSDSSGSVSSPCIPIHLPLSIVTSHEELQKHKSPLNLQHTKRFCGKDPLDYSVKKEDLVENLNTHEQHISSNKRQITSTFSEQSSSATIAYPSSTVSPNFTSPQKIPRLSLNVLTKSTSSFQREIVMENGGFNGSTLLKCSESLRCSSGVGTFSSGPSTSTIAEADTSSSKDSMWRPW